MRAAVALWVFLAAGPCLGAEILGGIDTHPHRVGSNAWSFSVKLPSRPIGTVLFVGAQFDLKDLTNGIAVDYAFNGPGIDFVDGRAQYGFAPTLFDFYYGPLNGWNLVDAADGVFSGILYATAPPASVRFVIVADAFVSLRR
jgi:hypothetical protein